MNKPLMLLLLLNYNLSYTQKTFNQGTINQKEYYEIIPFEFIRGKVFINVEINNKKRNFIVDTGAPTSISTQLCSELGLDIEKIPVRDSGGKTDSLGVTILKELKINDLIFKETKVIVLPNEIFSNCYKIDGIIGSNQLRNSIVQFNKNTKEIIITNEIKKLNLRKIPSTKVEFNDIQSSPNLWITLIKNNFEVKEMVLFDTGDQDFYSLSKNSFNFIENKYEVYNLKFTSTGSFTHGIHGKDAENTYYYLNFPNIKIGKINFTNIYSKTTYDTKSRIGSEIFDYGTVTLDYKNKKFYFDSFSNEKEINVINNDWNVKPTYEKENLVIGIIWDEKLANVLNIGDEIIEVNNIDLRKMTLCEKLKFQMDKSLEKMSIIVKDKNTKEEKRIEINKMK